MPAPNFEREQAADGWPRRERYHPAVMSIWLANIVATIRDDPTSRDALLSDGAYMEPSGSRDADSTPNKENPAPPRPSRREGPEPWRAEPWELAWIRR